MQKNNSKLLKVITIDRGRKGGVRMYYDYYDKCNNHDSKKKDDHCNRSLAAQLRKNIGQWVVIYEKNAIVYGYVVDVKDYATVVLEDAIKLVFDFPLLLEFDNLVISICEITEFAPITTVAGTTLVEALRANAQ